MIRKEYDEIYKQRARDLVSQMTLEEKFTQMTYRSQAIPRLGIPAYNWWNEALHGVARAGVATMFPQAIGLAAMFDDEFMQKIADVISTEGRAKYHAFSSLEDRAIYKGLTFWSPNVNIFRDPRWGRGHETYGEDPYLTSRMGVAFVKGLQGDDEKYLKTAACAKHFAVHSGPEKIRHEFDAQASPKDMWETYLPAFEALVTEAKVEAVMGAYNRTNGEPCCGSKTLIQEILRGKWQFDGHFVSDCWAIMDFHNGHHVTATAPQSAAMALEAGCDVNCGVVYLQLQIALNEGLITEEQIDQALIRLYTTRMRLGMFDQNVPYADIPYEEYHTKAHEEINLEAAKRSMVLLKNNGALPLKEKKIAVIGPNADNRVALMGNYHGDASRYITVLEGLQDELGEDNIIYALGCNLWRPDTNPNETYAGEGFAEAILAVQHADAAVVVLGLDETLEGEEMHESNAFGSGDKYGLELPGHQQKLLETVVKAAEGKPVILVMMTGSAIDMAWADENVDAVVQAWYPGSRGGKAVADLLLGAFSPAGRLPVTFYRSTEELPEFTDYSMRGRTYRYMENEALYPFGYGLSYTTFVYDGFEVPETVSGEEDVEVSVQVTNTGNMASDETAQLYLAHKSETTATPKWALKGFKRVFLQPGESKTVTFCLRPYDLLTVQDDGSRVVEKGEYTLYAGGGAPDSRTQALGIKDLKKTFKIQ